ncbi:DUF4430 domain-containing protein [Ectobacillus ponti]|uniref:DUF4430 domain-containing protein n=1 Tax=Ectobacillus ponti TaxID=2961894 RepID=A0AA42BUN9_9BACI|nr:DUF4430 domain-containing protein [Ectobacillus ponti]MCP8970708.1 DUF4430 domain-containing protein [Ectobacillus ponti]
MKKWTKWAAAFVLALAVLVLPFGQGRSVAFAQTPTATLVVIGDASHKVMVCPKQVELKADTKALDVLKEAVGAENVTVEGYLTAIKDLKQGDGGPNSYWGFRINDVDASEGSDTYTVKAGDVIEFRYVLDWANTDERPVNEVLTALGSCGTGVVLPNPGQTPPDTPKETVPQADAAKMKNSAAAYVLQQGVKSDWQLIGLARAGVELPKDLKEKYLMILEERVNDTSKRLQGTDLARTILAVTAAGGYAEQFAGKNLVEKMYNDTATENMNAATGYTYALLALTSRDYEIPSSAKWTREKLVQHLLQLQHQDGGWAYSSELTAPSDADVTGMVLTSLAVQKDQPQVPAALEKARKFLQSSQLDNGGYGYDGAANTNTTAQAIMGLLALGIDPAGAEFTKNGHNPLQSLASFQLDNGGFKYVEKYTAADGMATEQALYTLAQYAYFKEGKGSIFRWTLTAAPKPAPAPVQVPTPAQPSTVPPVSNTTAPAQTASGQTGTSAASGQTLPDTAMFGASETAAAAGGLVLILAGATLWRRKAA